MLYDDDDLSHAERAAWQRGDLATAELLSRVLDAEELAAEKESAETEAREQAEKERDLALEALRDAAQRAEQLIVRIEGLARMSERDSVLDDVLTLADWCKDRSQ